jgi:hypothetical protein
MNKDRRAAIAAIFPLIGEVAAKLQEAIEAAEGVKDEEEEYLEAMPESLKNSDKGEVSLAAVAALDEALDALGSIDAAAILRALEEAGDRAAQLDLPPARLTKDAAHERRWERLPQWVKDEIERHKAAVAALERKMAAMFGEPKEGSNRPVVADYSTPMEGRELPCRRVKWPAFGITVEVEDEGGRLIVHGDRQITILPIVGNQISIHTKGGGGL